MMWPKCYAVLGRPWITDRSINQSIMRTCTYIIDVLWNNLKTKINVYRFRNHVFFWGGGGVINNFFKNEEKKPTIYIIMITQGVELEQKY